MDAKELQEQAENIKLDYDGFDDRVELLVLQVGANIAVSLEAIKDMMQREHRVWFDRMEKGFIHAEGSDDLDPLPEEDPYRLG